jgi:Uncharacterized protein conserved in bacteria with the myosin-like domain
MKTLVAVCLLLPVTLPLIAQDGARSNPREFIWNYELPGKNESGPMDINVKGSYYFSKEIIGAKCNIYLHFRATSLEFMAKYGTRRYRYKGKIYREDEVRATDGQGSRGFDALKITSVSINLSVGNLRNPRNVTVGSNIAVVVGELDKDADLNHLSLNLATSRLAFANWSGSLELESRLMAMNKLIDKREQYKKHIALGDNLFNAGNWQQAKQQYQEAAALFSNESYPRNQISKIDKRLADEKAPAANAKKETATTPAKTGTIKNEDDLWGSPAKSTTAAKTTTTATDGRQPGIPANTPPMVMDNRGNYYVQNSSGKYVQTTKEHYESVKKDFYAVKNKQAQEAADAQKKKADQEALNRFYASQNAFMNDVKARQRKIEQESRLLANSFYAAQAQKEAKAGLRELSTLAGSFESLEELEAAYQSQRMALASQQEQLTEAGRNHVAASMDYAFKDADAKVGAYKGLATGLANLASDAAADKAAREARAQLEAERSRQEAAIKERKRQQMLSMRRALIKNSPDGGVPLSFHKVAGNDLYFFSYVLPKTGIETENPTILVSNVYRIQRYSDGSWPFKKSLQNELKKAAGTTDAVVMVGYYTLEADAKKMYESFISLAGKSGMQLKPFTYKGKKSSGYTSGGAELWDSGKDTQKTNNRTSDNDLWGTGSNKKTGTTQPAVKKNTEEDLWK